MILNELHQIFIAGLDEKSIENIRYSLFELVNNSIRAHKERKENRKIELRFRLTDEDLIITIKDWGGGFDKNDLPYDLDREVQDIDINDQNFMDYREKYEYTRFGMGLLISKKNFNQVKIDFLGPSGEIQKNYDPETTRGTLIELRSKIL